MTSFFQTVTDAINDIAQYGYESEERLSYWIEEIRRAAVQDMVTEAALTEQLKRVLGATYERLVEDGSILHRHPGVDRFTLQRIAPSLRAELDRRILASANLIRLNRERAINDTLRRFQGWATSIPIGGSATVNRREEKSNIRRGLTSLPFEERRVIIDQGHKLSAAISEIVATDAGAIGAVWRSHWRQAGYDYREDHKERDKVFYTIRDGWAAKRRFLRIGEQGAWEDHEKPGEFIFCLPGDASIPFADGVEVAYRRWYSGELTEVVTNSGKTFRATPNHPVLTPHGWRAVQTLKKGDHLIEVADQVFEPAEADQNNAVASIAEVFGALHKLGIHERRPGASEQFHGDGTESDIDIVWTNDPLNVRPEANSIKSVREFFFPQSYQLGSAAGSPEEFLNRGFVTPPGFMGQPDACLMLCRRFVLGDENIGIIHSPRRSTGFLDMPVDGPAGHTKASGDRESTFASIMSGSDFRCIEPHTSRCRQFGAEVDPSVLVPVPYRHRSDAEGLGDILNRSALSTQSVEIVHVNRGPWSGHVYNLQTANGWYIAQGIVTHNCRCYARYIYNLRDVPEDMLTERGKAALAEARERVMA